MRSHVFGFTLIALASLHMSAEAAQSEPGAKSPAPDASSKASATEPSAKGPAKPLGDNFKTGIALPVEKKQAQFKMRRALLRLPNRLPRIRRLSKPRP